MNFDSHSPSRKNGSANGRRVSALQRVAGTIPEGQSVGSSLDEFIASANQTLDDIDGWNLSQEGCKPEATPPPIPTMPAPLLSPLTLRAVSPPALENHIAAAPSEVVIAAREAARTAVEIARAAAEAETRRIVEEISRTSAQHMAVLQAKLAEAETFAAGSRGFAGASGSLPVVAPVMDFGTPSLSPGADVMESFAQPFAGTSMRLQPPGPSRAIKAAAVVVAAAAIAGAAFLLGTGRMGGGDSKGADRSVAAPVAAPAAAPAPADRQVVASEPAAAPAAAPIVSSTVPTVTPLEPDASELAASTAAPAKKARRNSPRKAKAKPAAKPKKSESESSGIVDPFAE
jgi:hypothetical protein